MGPRGRFFAVIALLAIQAFGDTPASAQTARTPGSGSEAGMSEDVQRMHEQLLALTEGEGSISDLRIEFMDTRGLSAHRSFLIEARSLVSKEWKSPGSPMIHLKGNVTDSRVTELIQELIDKQYWTFQGTRFVPDAPTFLFRFYYADLPYVDFRCDAEEFRQSPERAAIRDLFLKFVSETEMRTVPAK